jgi:DNA-binding transcriptional regulator GbsR (MarR family)
MSVSSSPSSSIATGMVVSAGRPPDVVAFEEQVVAFFLDAADLLGVPKSVAAIYGIVFATPKPLTFAEIESRLAISKGSVSQGLRVLREIGALKENQVAGSTVKAFVPDLELRKLITRFLDHRLGQQIESGTSRLNNLGSILPRISPRERGELSARLESLSDWHRKSRALLPIVKTMLKLG